MVYKAKETPEAPVIKKECTHYWLIEAAGGPTSQGVCKFCGAKSEFRNSWTAFAVVKRGAKPNVFELPSDSPDSESDDELDDSELEKASASL